MRGGEGRETSSLRHDERGSVEAGTDPKLDGSRLWNACGDDLCLNRVFDREAHDGSCNSDATNAMNELQKELKELKENENR